MGDLVNQATGNRAERKQQRRQNNQQSGQRKQGAGVTNAHGTVTATIGNKVRTPFKKFSKMITLGGLVLSFLFGCYMYSEIPDPGNTTENWALVVAGILIATIFRVYEMDAEDATEDEVK